MLLTNKSVLVLGLGESGLAMAKWLHPAQFKDVDPARSWQDMHQRFGAFTPAGTYWVGSR